MTDEEISLVNKIDPKIDLESIPTTEVEVEIAFVEESMIKKMTIELRQQKAVKGRNISVRDVISHMSDGIFMKNISGKQLKPCNSFGLLRFAWRGLYGYMHDVLQHWK